MSVREKFVLRFGEDNAKAIENAANEHKNGIHDKTGSDPFKWAILICIGSECVEKYSDYHKININFEEFKNWTKTEGELASHDGDCDFLALMCGVYDEYIGEKSSC